MTQEYNEEELFSLMASATAEYDMILKEFNNVREACKSASRTAEEMWYFRTVSGPQGSRGQKELRELRDLFKPSKVMIDGFRQDMLKLGYVVDENMQLVEDKDKSKGKQNKINAT